jgi:dinuclear metal center YbgI/SA1388 family protein
MTIEQIITYLETIAPPALQETYDNAGLIIGDSNWECTGILCCLDATETVIEESIEKKCNLVVAHHPIIFSGLKKINGKTYIERTVIKAIQNNIAIYALHTNLDNVLHGVNNIIATKLGLRNLSVLSSKNSQLKKLYFFVPAENAAKVMNAIFATGGGDIGNYSECSFTVNGVGTFKPNEFSNPYIGKKEIRYEAEELKIEILFPAYLQTQILSSLKANHPYEEVAYEVISIDNAHQEIGSGVIGVLSEPMNEKDFFTKLKKIFKLKVIKHTALRNKSIEKVAICGGAGSFLIQNAINSKSDIYITSDVKYHEYFDADGQIIIADIGHYESEQFTIDLFVSILEEKFPTFAVLKTGVNTNAVHYF